MTETCTSIPPTYVRKVGDGQYEYGFVRYSTNFRKRPDVYTPIGTRQSVVDAETARAALEVA